MEGFISGVTLCILISGSIWWNADTDARYLYSRLQYGEKACEQHGGLESFDRGADFKCKNGLIVQVPMEAAAKEIGEKLDKTGA